MSITQPTPPKLGLRARLHETERLLRVAIANANNGTFVANAMFWKLGLKNREEIKAIVDEYMEFMKAKVAEAKAKQASGPLENAQIIEGFIDKAILDKVAEHADSATTDSSAE